MVNIRSGAPTPQPRPEQPQEAEDPVALLGSNAVIVDADPPSSQGDALSLMRKQFNRLTWLIVLVLIVGEVIGGVCGLGTSWWLVFGNKEGAMLAFLKVFLIHGKIIWPLPLFMATRQKFQIRSVDMYSRCGTH
jgi:hypothetical protein